VEHEKKQVQPIEDAPVDYKFEELLKAHLRQIKKDGVIEGIRKRQYYVKPSDAKRLKLKERKNAYR